jgi:PhzF family phenazine biosynthesis protein
MKHRFHQLDVFTATPLLGNPLAVVHGAQGLSDAQMAAFARWTNLSETTFLLPPTQPEADYRVRIFTPATELPFAGHPTLGSCFAWLAAGGQARSPEQVVQECGVGLVRVRRDVQQGVRDGVQHGVQRLAFAAPPLRRTGLLDAATLRQIELALALQAGDVLHHQWVDNGPGWCAVMLRTAAQVLALKPNFAALGALKLGVIAPHLPGADAQFEVRAFVPALSVPEDPVTGSLNAGLAQWLIGAGLASTHYVAAQGTALGRAGRVYLQQSGADVWVGGDVVSCVEGEVTL